MAGRDRLDGLTGVLVRDLDARRNVLDAAWLEANDVTADELMALCDHVSSALRVSRELHATDPVWWARLLAASLARDLAGDPGKGGVR